MARADSERLAKESTNIIQNLIEEENKPMQEQTRKFTLSEMWEVAFYSLSRLEARSAFLMVKGAMENPVQIWTLDNPIVPKAVFPFSEAYKPQPELEREYKERHTTIEAAITSQAQTEKPKKKSVEPPPDDLSFLDKGG